MVQELDKLSSSGPAGNGGVERRPQDQLRLFAGVLLTKVPQELKESNITRQVELAEATEHAQVGLEQGEQALRAILVDVTTRVFLLRINWLRVFRSAGAACIGQSRRQQRYT